MNTTILPITSANEMIFQKMVQYYECEFSLITKKRPDQDCIFALDTPLDDAHQGFYVYHDQIPAGFAIIGIKEKKCYEVNEFFIIPCFRTVGIGKSFAYSLFDLYRGQWEIKQLINAKGAQTFWRKVCFSYTHGAFIEDIYHDSYWGETIRQIFSNSQS